MTEYWKDIPEYEGLYQASTLGRIKSLKDNHGNDREKILKPRKDKYGYLYVDLCKNRNNKSCKIHRLVAQAFIHNPNPKYYTQVNHIDENKLNNNLDNLEWCTAKYNANYGTRNERMSKSKNKSVIGINKINGYIIEFSSISEAERVIGINHSNIVNCCKERQKSAGGYRWFYSNKEVEK